MSPNGVFTKLMSQDEAKHALGIKLTEHMSRLALAHYQKHWPVSKMFPFHSMQSVVDMPVFFDGEFIKSLAECDDCFPALQAAKYEKPSLHQMVVIAEPYELGEE